MRLLLGGVVLSNDGSILGFPDGGKAVYADPGKTVTFDETFEATLPLDAPESVRVFGTQEREAVDWYRLTQTARARNGGALEQALDRYISGTRGQTRRQLTEMKSFTVSSLTLRVKANVSFLESKTGSSQAPNPREYTIPNFDARPYYPDNVQTALYRVLTMADRLTKTKIGYKQHPWKKASDEENLTLGMDCSRFTWFVFTRARLPYTEGDAYLPTAGMIGADSPLAKHFDRCDTRGQYHLGDLLVYRDEKQGDGHVVMVIDPLERIAIGSHGWDGNARDLPFAPLTGVQYQKIKFKQDWRSWDRTGMEVKACWRYRSFVQEARQEGGRPGMKALAANPCDVACPALPPAPVSSRLPNSVGK